MLSLNGVERISIFKDCVDLLTARPSLEPPNLLDVAKMVLTNVKMTCKSLQKGRLTHFNPHVDNNLRHIPALEAIAGYMDFEMHKEAAVLKKQTEGFLKRLVDLFNQEANNGSWRMTKIDATWKEQFQGLNMDPLLSERMDFLVRAHFLTLGTNCQNIKDYLKTRVSTNFLRSLVQLHRERMELLIAQEISLQEAGLHSLKTTLSRLLRLQVPILMKDHAAYFRTPAPGKVPVWCEKRELIPEQPVLVIEWVVIDNQRRQIVTQGIRNEGFFQVIFDYIPLFATIKVHAATVWEEKVAEPPLSKQKLG